MTTFETSANILGRADDVLQSAVTTLTNNGFAIIHRDSTSISLAGPGLKSKKQNPLLGASTIRLQLHANRLDANAELGGVEAMQRFLMRFPLLLGLGLGLCFGIGSGLLFGRQFGVGFGVPWAQGWTWMLVAIGFTMLPVAPWLVLSPLMSRTVRCRTEKAIETLVLNATFVRNPA